MNKSVYLGLSIIDLMYLTVMYAFWYDYVKPNYSEKPKLCYMDTDSFIFHVKADYLKKDLTLHIMKQIDRCL